MYFPRNSVLAEACFRGGYIDSWGSGIMKIVNSCKAAALPAPVLEKDGGGFIVRLFNIILVYPTPQDQQEMNTNFKTED